MQAGNTSSWSKSISVYGFQIPIEAISGQTFCEPFSERQVSLWQNGKICNGWSVVQHCPEALCIFRTTPPEPTVVPVPLTVQVPVALVMLISVVALVALIASEVVVLSHWTCVDTTIRSSSVSSSTTRLMATTP